MKYYKCVTERRKMTPDESPGAEEEVKNGEGEQMDIGKKHNNVTC